MCLLVPATCDACISLARVPGLPLCSDCLANGSFIYSAQHLVKAAKSWLPCQSWLCPGDSPSGGVCAVMGVVQPVWLLRCVTVVVSIVSIARDVCTRPCRLWSMLVWPCIDGRWPLLYVSMVSVVFGKARVHSRVVTVAVAG